jgi:hypothetical protein
LRLAMVLFIESWKYKVHIHHLQKGLKGCQ